jgi:hypothetical protein
VVAVAVWIGGIGLALLAGRWLAWTAQRLVGQSLRGRALARIEREAAAATQAIDRIRGDAQAEIARLLGDRSDRPA